MGFEVTLSPRGHSCHSDQGPVTSYHKFSSSLEATRFVFKIDWSLWNLMPISQTSWDLTIRQLMGYWNGSQALSSMGEIGHVKLSGLLIFGHVFFWYFFYLTSWTMTDIMGFCSDIAPGYVFTRSPSPKPTHVFVTQNAIQCRELGIYFKVADIESFSMKVLDKINAAAWLFLFTNNKYIVTYAYGNVCEHIMYLQKY